MATRWQISGRVKNKWEASDIKRSSMGIIYANQ